MFLQFLTYLSETDRILLVLFCYSIIFSQFKMGKYHYKKSSKNQNRKKKPINREDNYHHKHESITNSSYYPKSVNKKNSIDKTHTFSLSKYRNYSRSPSYHSPSPSYSSSSESSASSPSYSQSQISSMSSAAQRHRVEHFKYAKGQKLNHRYKVKKLLGDGTFGRVVQCKYRHKLYAVKIIKPVEKYINSARIERSIIKRINDRDEEDNFGIVRYVQSFYHYGHFCMVFKPLGKSLYEFLKMNNFRGFPLPLVQSFFKQILTSIGFLHRNGYTHTDLKPENILFQRTQFIETSTQIPYRYQGPKYQYNESTIQSMKKYFLPLTDKIRIIDFGGATRYDDYHSSIINTRQYRGPEVILQCCQWNQISDIWSIACIVCQLYTGELLFPAYDDQEHLAMIQKNSGKFPGWMISKIPHDHQQRKIFQDGFINQSKLSNITNIIGMKVVEDNFPVQPQLVNLLRLCLQIDPNKRINCMQALRHPFFSRKYH